MKRKNPSRRRIRQCRNIAALCAVAAHTMPDNVRPAAGRRDTFFKPDEFHAARLLEFSLYTARFLRFLLLETMILTNQGSAVTETARSNVELTLLA